MLYVAPSCWNKQGHRGFGTTAPLYLLILSCTVYGHSFASVFLRRGHRCYIQRSCPWNKGHGSSSSSRSPHPSSSPVTSTGRAGLLLLHIFLSFYSSCLQIRGGQHIFPEGHADFDKVHKGPQFGPFIPTNWDVLNHSLTFAVWAQYAIATMSDTKVVLCFFETKWRWSTGPCVMSTVLTRWYISHSPSGGCPWLSPHFVCWTFAPGDPSAPTALIMGTPLIMSLTETKRTERQLHKFCGDVCGVSVSAGQTLIVFVFRVAWLVGISCRFITFAGAQYAFSCYLYLPLHVLVSLYLTLIGYRLHSATDFFKERCKYEYIYIIYLYKEFL